MAKRLAGLNDLAYRGVNAASPPNVTRQNRAPGVGDTKNVNIGDIWIHNIPNNNSNAYILTGLSGNVATWVLLGGATGDLETLTGDLGGPVGPTASNINIQGAANSEIVVVGDPFTSTLTIDGPTSSFSVTTTDATPTTLFTIALLDNTFASFSGSVRVARSDYSSGGFGEYIGAARKQGAAAAVLVGTPIVSFTEDSTTGDPVIDIVINANTLELVVTGEVATTYNWETTVDVSIIAI